MNVKIATVEIMDWSAHDANAIHYYASFSGITECGNYKKVEIYHKLTQKEADEYNKAGYKISATIYDETQRFSDYGELMAHIKKKWKKEFPKAKILLRGSASFSVQEALFGPKKAVERINELYKEAVELGYYGGTDDKRMEEIDAEFDSIIKGLK